MSILLQGILLSNVEHAPLQLYSVYVIRLTFVIFIQLSLHV